jgi:hypothetical protein
MNKNIIISIVLLSIAIAGLTGIICYDYGYSKGILKGVQIGAMEK